VLNGKKFIVTGGSYGIGSNVVKGLVAQGARVASLARSVELGEKGADELTAMGPGRAKFFRCDISDRSQVKQAFAAAVDYLEGLDGLVNVAGVEAQSTPEEESDDQWDWTMGINAKGTFITNQEAFPFLKEKGGGIINFGSGAGLVGMPDAPAYAASKGAVVAWSRSIAAAWGRHAITVNVVCPAIVSPMYRHFRETCDPDLLRIHDEAMARSILIGGQLGDADRDLVPMVLFLLDDGGRFVTGQTINVDGGLIMSR
jgi:NAD(P)-dependent dehydrogenase (short-subunit alcohol dehydrogenase family)